MATSKEALEALEVNVSFSNIIFLEWFFKLDLHAISTSTVSVGFDEMQ